MSDLSVSAPYDFDPYVLDDGSDTLLAAFDDTIVSRGHHRIDHSTVTQTGPVSFAVPGDPRLGDTRAFYNVIQDGRFWRCWCAKGQGHNVCSHITAAILFRRDNPNAWQPAPEDSAVRLRVGESHLPPRKVVDPVEAAHQSDGTMAACPLPNDPIFGKPALPAKFSSIRPHQWDAVQDIIEQFETKDLVFCDAPTGSGKTLIAELVRRLLGAKFTAYICSSIQLQQQFTSDFSYSREIKGRSNYETLSGYDGVTCADCTAAPPHQPECFWCEPMSLCPYRQAKSVAISAPLAVLNTSYFLHATNFAKEFGDRGLVIVDECDVLEGELMNFVEVSIGDRLIKDLKLGQPKHVTKPESWQEWIAGTVLPALSKARSKIPATTTDVPSLRRRRNLAQLIQKLDTVKDGLVDGNWVFDDYQQGRATFRPIRVDGFGGELLWPHGKKWLLMSATIVSPDTLAESLGWEKDFGVVKVPHTFPVENRRINVVPVANMTNKQKDTAWPAMGNALANLADIHADQRMLVHTVSYELTRYLHDFLADHLDIERLYTYTVARDRERVLSKFKQTPGGILLAPSMDRGVDLPGEDAEVVAIAKVPFLSLGNKQVNARLRSRGGDSWYAVEAIRSLVQMSGRHIRSADDIGITYILDGQFGSNIWSKSRHYLPGWFRESLNFSHPKQPIVQPRELATTNNQRKVRH